MVQDQDTQERPSLTVEQQLEEDPLLSTNQAADYLGLTAGAIYMAKSKGKLTGIKNGKNVFFTKEELDRYHHATSGEARGTVVGGREETQEEHDTLSFPSTSEVLHLTSHTSTSANTSANKQVTCPSPPIQRYVLEEALIAEQQKTERLLLVLTFLRREIDDILNTFTHSH